MYGASLPDPREIDPIQVCWARYTDIGRVSLVANNFWGKEDAGVSPLLERMAGAKQTCDELRSFYSGKNLHMPS